MTSHPLLPMPENSAEISDSYALLGRALAFATEFENNCRTLAHLTNVLHAKSEYSYEVYMLLKSGTLNEKIHSFSQEYELPEHTTEVVHAARKARNSIAHSISLEHKKLLSTASGRASFRASIFGEMRDLIEGNQLVQDMIRLLIQNNKEAHGSDCVEYFFAVCEWLDGQN
ncbi:DUF4145 domain-containing protein [Vibrio parahaemolyticus]|nr:DUF4145 domain-containing protein [Vibrio parahaemolyticus]